MYLISLIFFTIKMNSVVSTVTANCLGLAHKLFEEYTAFYHDKQQHRIYMYRHYNQIFNLNY